MLPHLLGHLTYGVGKDAVQFLFGDAQQGVVAMRERDVVGLVEAAEHRHLRELGDAREQHEAQVVVGGLEDGEETLQQVAVPGQQLLVVGIARLQEVEQRLVVLVDEHHHLLPRLLVDGGNQATEAQSQVINVLGGDSVSLSRFSPPPG